MTKKYAVISMHNDTYQPLADITSANKVAYCNKHGYDYLMYKTGERDEVSRATEGNNHFFGFLKIETVLKVLETTPYEWVLFSECDAMITNFGITLESIADNNFHVLLSSCFNRINAGNFMVRNSDEGKGYLKFIMSQHEAYKTVGWAEQQVMIDNLEKFKGVVKIVPQRTFNSYDDFLYVLHNVTNRNDGFGRSGEWQPGDFQVHWPGMNLDQRLELAKKYSKLVVGV